MRRFLWKKGWDRHQPGAAGDWCVKRSLGNGVGESMFLMWTPGTRGGQWTSGMANIE